PRHRDQPEGFRWVFHRFHALRTVGAKPSRWWEGGSDSSADIDNVMDWKVDWSGMSGRDRVWEWLDDSTARPGPMSVDARFERESSHPG
ncbi:MAG TPA: hypothetical protein PKY05_10625, partial [Fibrobacteria bacterium]|nr:hypothetical protein [Fibrobacteria bacterium]